MTAKNRSGCGERRIGRHPHIAKAHQRTGSPAASGAIYTIVESISVVVREQSTPQENSLDPTVG